jgi:transcriptional regulator with XRE-family HTH domain
METQTATRTVRPDAEAIKRLRLEKGWRAEDLATKALCSVKTIVNIERGASVYVSTLAKLAKVLGVEFMTLVQGSNPQPEQPKLLSDDEKPKTPTLTQPRVKVQITVDIPYENFDESHQLIDFIKRLTEIVQPNDEIVFADVRPGSTIITLDMSIADCKRLVDKLFTLQSSSERRALHITALQALDNYKYVPIIETINLPDKSTEATLPPSVQAEPLPIPKPTHTDFEN